MNYLSLMGSLVGISNQKWDAEADKQTSSLKEQVPQLVQRWFDAADYKLNPSDKKVLYEVTKGFIDQTKVVFYSSKLKEIAGVILQEFEKHDVGERETLARWVASETRFNSNAYPSLHLLFSFAAKAKDCEEALSETAKTIEVREQIWEVASLAHIDSAALRYFNVLEMNKRDLCSLHPDIRPLVLSRLKLTELGNFRGCSVYSRKMANDELVRWENEGRIHFGHIGIRNNIGQRNDLKQIVQFFGESCSKISRLDLSYNSTNDFRFLENFPNLTVLILDCSNFSNSLDKDIHYLLLCKKIEQLDLNVSNLKNYSFLVKLPNLQKLCLYKHSRIELKDLLALRNSSENGRKIANEQLAMRLGLGEITLENLGFSKEITSVQEIIDFFGESCSKIEILDLSNYPHLTDPIALIKKCPNLRNLHLYNSDAVDDL
jgi:hypothetical protein